MKSVGIVAEYNPFHFGHEYHIEKTRELVGEECAIICAMSGDFVQRGEAALYSKFARAEAAVCAGADLVLELPLPWSLSSAEGFARGAVALLAAAGVQYISFGSEVGDCAPLEALADILCAPEMNEKVKKVLGENATLSYALARRIAVEKEDRALAALLDSPNNILAVEYLKAIRPMSPDITPLTVQRAGAGHDAQGNAEGISSAMEIRNRIARGDKIERFVPPAAAAVYAAERARGRELASHNAMELCILSRLRMLPKETFLALPDADGGAGARLYEAARTQPTLEDVLASAKTKRYALARIRRMTMCAALGITADMANGTPPYLRVLAASQRGCAVLRALNDSESAIPVITKPAAVKALSAQCTQVFAIGASAHDLYTLAFPSHEARGGGEDWKTSPKIVKIS